MTSTLPFFAPFLGFLFCLSFEPLSPLPNDLIGVKNTGETDGTILTGLRELAQMFRERELAQLRLRYPWDVDNDDDDNDEDTQGSCLGNRARNLGPPPTLSKEHPTKVVI